MAKKATFFGEDAELEPTGKTKRKYTRKVETMSTKRGPRKGVKKSQYVQIWVPAERAFEIGKMIGLSESAAQS